MDIRHSNRILLLGRREAGALDIVRDLTGSAPEPDVSGSTAGLTHEWMAETPYYTAKIPIWIDELSDVQSWAADFLKPEAKDVVGAVGAWVYCFARQADGRVGAEAEEAMKSIQQVVEEHSYGSEAVFLAVAKPVGKHAVSGVTGEHQEEQEVVCTQYGFEYIDYGAAGRNEFGERMGFERLQEALEANEWETGASDDIDLDDLDFTAEDFGDFGTEEAEMTAELFGMKAALNNEDEYAAPEAEFTSTSQSIQVDDLDKLMSKLLAVKEQSVGLPEEERKKRAAKAVKDIMEADPNLG